MRRQPEGMPQVQAELKPISRAFALYATLGASFHPIEADAIPPIESREVGSGSEHFISRAATSVLPQMHGELALAIALAAHGNAYLGSPRDSMPPELVGTNSTLQYVNLLVFHGIEGDIPLSSAAQVVRRTEQGRFEDLKSPQGTSAWFLKLRRAGATKLSVAKLPVQLDLPEVIAASFSGGIPWAIEVDTPSSSWVWIPRWKHEGGSKKSWSVYVSGFAVTPSRGAPLPDLTVVAKSMHSTLTQALDFSIRAKLEFFPDDFSQALALLDSQSPEIPNHPDLLPPIGYSLLARQLTASASRAWVFGGMMSFNDLGFKELELEDEYKALLPGLYDTVVNALLSAANSYGRG